MFDTKSKDINDEGASQSPMINRLVIWLAVFGLGVCFMPVMLISTTLRTHEQAMATQVFELQGTLAAPPLVSDKIQSLSQTLITSQTTLKQITALQTQLAADHMDWAALMGSVSRYDSATLTITSLSRAQHQITLTGQAQHEIDVMTYLDGLRGSGLFEQVPSQSLVTATATATPSLIATPNSPPFPVTFVLILTVTTPIPEKATTP